MHWRNSHSAMDSIEIMDIAETFCFPSLVEGKCGAKRLQDRTTQA